DNLGPGNGLDLGDVLGGQGGAEDRRGQDDQRLGAQRASPAAAVSMRAIQRAGARISSSVGSASGPCQTRFMKARSREAITVSTNRSPAWYCSIFRSSPVSRRMARSSGPRFTF